MRALPFIAVAIFASLFAGCPLPSPLNAKFVASVRSGDAPLQVSFFDRSDTGPTPIVFWEWQFGDGLTSNAINPVHTYLLPGRYTVTLRVANAAGESIEIQPNHITVDLVLSFDDPNLEAVLREALAIPSGPLRRSDLQRLDTLDAEDRSIEDLSGLEFAQNLRTLNLAGNAIANIDALASMTALQNLNLEENLIEDLAPLAFLRDLRNLNLAANSVSDLRHLENLTLLRELNLSENPGLADITVLARLSRLEDLSLSYTRMNGFAPLLELTRLRALDVAGNGLTSLVDLGLLEKLEILTAFDNAITDVSPLEGMLYLRRLQLSHNLIADIEPLRSLISLELLTLQFNAVQSIAPIVGNPGIGRGDTVRVDGNPLNNDALCVHVPLLRERGVAVEVTGACLPNS